MADEDVNIDDNTMDMTNVIEDTNNDGKITVDDLTYENYLEAGWTDEQLLKDDRLKVLVPEFDPPEIEIKEEPPVVEEVKPEADEDGWVPMIASIAKKSKAFMLLKTADGRMVRVRTQDFKADGKKLFTKLDCEMKVIKPIKKDWVKKKK